MRLAILDYGIGGLGIYQLLRKELPAADLLYFSDAGEVPYGQMEQFVLNARIAALIAHAAALGAEQMIIACHSASTALDFITPAIPAIGMQEATVEAVHVDNGKEVAVIGGGRTVAHGFYKEALSARGFAVKQANAQALSILIEAGKINDAEVMPALREILLPLLPFEQLVLACTHYPVLMPQIASLLPAEVRIIDPATQVLARIKNVLSPLPAGQGTSQWYCSGEAALMSRAAKIAWGLDVPTADITLVRA